MIRGIQERNGGSGYQRCGAVTVLHVARDYIDALEQPVVSTSALRLMPFAFPAAADLSGY